MPQCGKLKVYLGFAPGVGKTCAMLNEGHDLQSRGHRVVVGLVEDHGRARTRQLVDGLEVIPTRTVSYHGNTYRELDTAAIIAAEPEYALVDELAHTVVAEGQGSEFEEQRKRWHDVYTLLDAGIDVISTMNIQHLESLNDVVAAVTGVRQLETVPDRVLRDADEIELVDLSPDTLRIRLSRGEIYNKEQAELALRKYFRPGNLSALRELSLLWLADKVEEVLDDYRDNQEIDAQWATRERVVVAVRDDGNAEAMIRRGARMTGRVAGREMIVVHITDEDDGLDRGYMRRLRKLQNLTESLGGQWRTIVGDDVPGILLEFSRTVNASQLVIGSERGLHRYVGLSTTQRIIEESGPIDVHIISSSSEKNTRRRRELRSRFSPPRQLTGWLFALVGPPLLTAALSRFSIDPEYLGVLLLSYLTLVVFAAMAAGWIPAFVAVVIGSLLANWYFTQPVHTLTITQPASLVQIVLFSVIAAAVAAVVERSERRRTLADKRLGQAVVMSELAHGVIHDGDSISKLVHGLADTFSLKRVDLQRYLTERKKWVTIGTTASSGISEPWPDDMPMMKVKAGEELRLVLSGRELNAAETAMIAAHGSRIRALLDIEEIAAMRRATAALEAGNRVGRAVLTAVSHDLRTPLASIKAAVSSMTMDDIELDDESEKILLDTIESSADRLGVVIGNLLDAARINSNTLRVESTAVNISDVVDAVCAELPEAATHIERDIDETAAVVDGDPGLIQRIISNIVVNGRQYAPASKLMIRTRAGQGEAGALSGNVDIFIIDHGQGIPDDKIDEVFQPFHRLGDHLAQSQGLGLGLAAAAALAETMGGSIRAEHTPGGGATFVVSLPRADDDARNATRAANEDANDDANDPNDSVRDPSRGPSHDAGPAETQALTSALASARSLTAKLDEATVSAQKETQP